MADKQGFVQTRSETNGMRFFSSINEAMAHACEDETVWKISISLPNRELIRLVRSGSLGYDERWEYDPIVIH